MSASAPICAQTCDLSHSSNDNALNPPTYVKQHKRITLARQPLMSLLAKRILGRALSQITSETDLSQRPQFTVYMAELVPEAKSRQNAYAWAEAAVKELADVS